MYVCVYKIFWKGFISLDAIKEIHVCVCVCVCVCVKSSGKDSSV